MKRDTSITGGNIRNKLHIIGKFVSRGRIETFPNLVASIRTISVQQSGLLGVLYLYVPMMGGGGRNTIRVYRFYVCL